MAATDDADVAEHTDDTGAGPFAGATAVWTDGHGGFRGEIHTGWDIGGHANGGYLLALAARAASEAAEGREPLTVSAHYLAPGPTGPVNLYPTVYRQGSRLSTVGVTLSTGERSLLRMLGSFHGGHDSSVETVERTEAEPPDLPGPDQCVRVEPAEPMPPPIMGKVDLRLHPDDATFSSGRPLIRGWLRLQDDEPIDAFGLLLAVDVFPPTAFNARLPVAWVPTVELTAHIRGRPEPGWLRCQFTTRHISGGFMEEDGEVWDESGRLVAQSRQLALVPRVEG